MLKNGVYILRKDASPIKDVNLKKSQELEVVNNVIWMGGYPLPFEMQPTLNKWMSDNPNLFIDDTRR